MMTSNEMTHSGCHHIVHVASSYKLHQEASLSIYLRMVYLGLVTIFSSATIIRSCNFYGDDTSEICYYF